MPPEEKPDNGLKINYHDLVDDRLADGVFRVDRSVYLNRQIFEEELIKVFDRHWRFLCH